MVIMKKGIDSFYSVVSIPTPFRKNKQTNFLHSVYVY